VKKCDKISSYISLIYKGLKLANHYEIDPLIIPLDFIALQHNKLEGKLSKIINKILGLLKSVIYELSMESN
jgi:hypothetical protein